MDFFTQVLDKVFLKNGYFGAIALIIVVVVAIITYCAGHAIFLALMNERTLNRFLSKLPLIKNYISSDTSIDLSSHVIFSKYELLISKVHSAKVKCPLRKRIFQKLIAIRLESHKEQSLQLIKEDFTKIDHDEFKIRVMKFLAKSHIDWTTKSAALNLPSALITKMDAEFADMKIFAETFICNICDSTRFYDDNIEKINMILDLLAVLEELTVTTLEKVMDKLNGELSKAEFEGVKCKKCDEDFCPQKNMKF